MRDFRKFLPLLLLPLGGCVFAVGSDGEGNERLRDRVRDLEKRVYVLEKGGGQVVILQDGKTIQVEGGAIRYERKEGDEPGEMENGEKEEKK